MLDFVSKSWNRLRTIRRILAIVKRFLGLVLLVLEVVRRWLDLTQ